MIQSKQFQFSLLTWAQLLVLFVPSVSLGAAAQSAVQPVPSFASRQNWDPSIAAMVGALFCAFLFMGFFSIYLRRCSESYLTVQNHIGTSEECPCSCSQGVDRKVIDTFPILVYSTIKDLKIGKESLECAVCLNEFKDYETLRLLPKCNHVFHPTCIDTWLSSHVTCPVCRDKLSPDCGEVVIEVPTQSNANELNEGSPISRDEQDETEDQHPGVPDVNEAQSSGNSGETDIVTVDEATGKQSPPLNSTRFGELTRSNSTGHCQVEPEKNVERYTLRLPEDVRKYILRKHGSIRRSASCNMIMPMVGSSRKGFCCSDNVEQQGLWVLSRAPPFVSRQC